MLYDGALKFMEAAKHAMGAKDYFRQNANLVKAQKIVSELMSCLDMQQGGEIATNLFALYTYVGDELVKANVGDDVEAVDRCIRVMSELRESWAAVESSLRNGGQERLAA